MPEGDAGHARMERSSRTSKGCRGTGRAERGRILDLVGGRVQNLQGKNTCVGKAKWGGRVFIVFQNVQAFHNPVALLKDQVLRFLFKFLARSFRARC